MLKIDPCSHEMPDPLGVDSSSSTNRSPPGYGSGRSSTEYTALKMAVSAPMPRARVRMMTSERPARPANAAHGVAQILQDGLDSWKLPRLMRPLASRSLISEMASCRSTRVSRRHASRDVLFDQKIDMLTASPRRDRHPSPASAEEHGRALITIRGIAIHAWASILPAPGFVPWLPL